MAHRSIEPTRRHPALAPHLLGTRYRPAYNRGMESSSAHRPRGPAVLAFSSAAVVLVLLSRAATAQDVVEPPEPPDRPGRLEVPDSPERPEPPARAEAPPIDVRDFRDIYAETPVTRAVDRGIEFLVASQLPDGSWLSPGYGKNTGIASLAILAILARGHQPGRGPHGEALERAVAWVLGNQKRGLIIRDTSHGEMYSHGISALMLGEVLGTIDEERPGLERIYRVHRSAVDIILRAQAVPKDRWDIGGWRYTPVSEDSDISVTGWQILALRAARDAGLPVPERSIRMAIHYVLRCAHPSGGFSYQPGDEPNIGRTGTGVLVLELSGEHGNPVALRGGDWLLAHPLEWRGPFFYYGAYYAAQAMYQLGGRHWEEWQPQSEALLVEKQGPDGSWPLPPQAVLEEQAGPIYTTAMAVLSLSVEFRYLPIYQR